MRRLPIRMMDFVTLKTFHRNLFNEAYSEMYKAELFDMESIYFKSGIFERKHHAYGYPENDPMLSTFIIKRLPDGKYQARLSSDSETLYLMDEQWIEIPFKTCIGTRRGIINAINNWQTLRFQYVKECKHLIKNIDYTNLKDI